MTVSPPSGETRIGPDGLPVGPPGPSAPAPSVPSVPLPDYDLVQVLGRGGMGVVYLARHKLSGRREALKVVTDCGSTDRFVREVRAVALLSHPNVVAMHGAWTAGGQVVLALEYVAGQDLARVVAARGPLPVAEACEYARQAAVGLQHAYERGVVHRDVKPHNLILAREEGEAVVKVADFGLAQASSDRPADPERTPEVLAVGTPGYMAPEQLTDPPQGDTRADVYGLGCTLYFLLTGGHPFGAGTPREVCRRQQSGELPPLRTVRPDVPAGLADVIARMTALDPADRYQTPAAAAEALAPFARSADAPAAVRTRSAKRRVVAAAVGLVVAITGASGLVAVSGSANTTREPAGVAEPAPADDGFVPLANGQDLSGWVVDGGGPGEWQVEGGAILTTGRKGGPRTWLLTDRDFADARFRFEYRLAAGANTGFAFRAVPGERPVLRPGRAPYPYPYHQQVEIADDADLEWRKLPTGQINAGGSVDGLAAKPVRPAPQRPAGEWNAAEIEFRGQSLRMWVNGVLVQDADLNHLVEAGSRYPALTRTRGRVGFQQQAGTVWFRGVAVRELPPALPAGPVAQSPPAE